MSAIGEYNAMYQNQLSQMNPLQGIGIGTSSREITARSQMIGQGLMTRQEDLLAIMQGTTKGKTIGGGVGTAIGGIIGGILGSVIPGAGTAAGAMLGATIGGFLGGGIGRAVGGSIGGKHALHKSQQQHQQQPINYLQQQDQNHKNLLKMW